MRNRPERVARGGAPRGLVRALDLQEGETVVGSLTFWWWAPIVVGGGHPNRRRARPAGAGMIAG